MWTKKVEKGGGNFEKPPAGNHPAVLVAMIDLGTQKQDYKGKITKPHRIYFCWELTAEPSKERPGQNLVAGMDYTNSLTEKAKLRAHIEARVGRSMPDGVDYDIRKELGQRCLLSLKQNGDYVNVDGMGALPKGMVVPDPKITPFLFSLFTDEGENSKLRPRADIDRDVAALPDWLPFLYGSKLADVIYDCEEFKGPATGGGVTQAGRQAAAEHAVAGAAAEEQVPW